VTAASLDPTPGDAVTGNFPDGAVPSTGLPVPGTPFTPHAVADTDEVRITVTCDGTTVRLSAAGEVDTSSAPVLRTHVEALLDRGVREVVLDLDEVSFLDSAGLAVLAGVHRAAGERGFRLRVLASGRAVIRPLQITGLWDLLGVEQVAPGSGRTA
jgi:anti-sigma B factor antagonist